jgi:hypothetical protein
VGLETLESRDTEKLRTKWLGRESPHLDPAHFARRAQKKDEKLNYNNVILKFQFI